MSTIGRTGVRRKLSEYWQTPGNARYKGLLLAAHPHGPSPEVVGREWITDPARKKHLSSRADPNKPKAFPEMDYTPKFALDGSSRELSAASSEFKDRELNEGIDVDKYISRMLAKESTEELDVLYREELQNTVIMGAQPVQIAREASTVNNVNKRKGDIPRGSARGYAPEISQGAEIRADEEDYDTVPFNTTKVGTGFAVSDELIDEAEVDVIERQVRYTGAEVENALNRMLINELVDSVIDAGNVFDMDLSGSGTFDAAAIIDGKTKPELRDYPEPETMLMHPKFGADLFGIDNLLFANRAGSNEVIQNGKTNDALGLTLFKNSAGAYNSSSNDWSWGSDGNHGAVAYSRDFVHTVVYQDLVTKDYDDPIRDLQGGNVRAHFDAVVGRDDAAQVFMQ